MALTQSIISVCLCTCHPLCMKYFSLRNSYSILKTWVKCHMTLWGFPFHSNLSRMSSWYWLSLLCSQHALFIFVYMAHCLVNFFKFVTFPLGCEFFYWPHWIHINSLYVDSRTAKHAGGLEKSLLNEVQVSKAMYVQSTWTPGVWVIKQDRGPWTLRINLDLGLEQVLRDGTFLTSTTSLLQNRQSLKDHLRIYLVLRE